MPIRLKHLTLRNWTTIKEASIDFPPKGLILVDGQVGAGKTAVGEAIARCLLGVDGRFTSAGAYSHDEVNEDTYVKLETELDGKPLVVELGYKCPELSKTGESLRFKFGEAEIWRDRIRATREELNKITTITPELAQWTVFLDGEKLSFRSLSQRDSVDLLMTALQQPPWSQYHERSKLVVGRFNRDLQKAVGGHESSKTSVAVNKKELDHAQKELDGERSRFDAETQELDNQLSVCLRSIASLKFTLASHDQERLKIKKEIKAIEDQHAATYAALDLKRRSTELTRLRAQKFKESRQEKLRGIQQQIREENLALKTMKEAPTSCPKCEKPWDKGHSELELSQQQSIIDNLLAKKVKLARLAEDAAADFNTYNEALRQIDAENQALGVETKVRALSSRYETLEWKTRNLNPDLTVLESTLARLQRGPDRTALTKKETLFEERTRAYLAAEIAVEASAKELTEAQEALKVVDYWNTAFGPTGISNMILRESIGPLNSVAKRISNLMTGGTINITYDTQRQLSSGLDRPELIIKVENKSGAKRVEGSSKGEAGMLNLLIAETLAEVGTVGARVGWRWYDEVVNSQDPIIRRTVFNYMKETADRLGILIFVVDHHPEVAGYADRILEAAKIADKHSAISWR